MGFLEVARSLSLRERRINNIPTGIESLGFERVGGDISIGFDNGVHSTINVTSPEYASQIVGKPITEAILTVSFSVPASQRYQRKTSYYHEPLGKLTLRGKGELEIKDGLPVNIQKDPVGFLSLVVKMLDDIEPGRVSVDPNWGWQDDQRERKVREHISGFTTPMRDWLAARETSSTGSTEQN